MIALDGSKKISIAVFISGKGSNFKSLYKFSKKKNSKYKINLVVSNNVNAEGLKFAKKLKIKNKIINYNNINWAENKILYNLKKNNIQLVCLAGFMKILSKKFLQNFKGNVLNIHPSLLPKYKGLNTHSKVIQNKEKYSGCTVHYVNSKLDSGEIILQKKVRSLQKR